MRARDIMTTSVLTARLNTPIREIAELLSKRHFSGLPVVDSDGRLLGIVSEGDLIHHSAIGADPKGKWWLDSLADPDAIARAYSKAHGQTAGDVMVRHVATISDEADLEAVATTLEARWHQRNPGDQGRTSGRHHHAQRPRVLWPMQIPPVLVRVVTTPQCRK